MEDEKACTQKALGDLFLKLQVEFPPLPPDSPMKILPENRGIANSDEDGSDGAISVCNNGSEGSGTE